MPRYPIVRAVDAPTATATVLYDFNDDVTAARAEAGADGFSLGALDLLGDPDAVGVEWSQQAMSIPQTVVAATKSAALARLQQMSRAVMRQRFWIMVQLTEATSPVWWHAYRTPPGDLSLDQVYTSGALTDRWQLTANVEVDAFSYGARVTQPAKLVGINPANAPASVSGGYVLPAVRGDAPTRLRVEVRPTFNQGGSSEWLVACVASSGTAGSGIIQLDVGDSDTFTNSSMLIQTRSGAVGGSRRFGSEASLGTSTYIRGNLGTATMARGRYLVLARVSASAFGVVTYQMRSFGGLVSYGEPVSVTHLASTQDSYQWVVLGTVAAGDSIPADVPTTTPVEPPAVDITAKASSTSTTIGMDQVLMVPVSGNHVVASNVLRVTCRNNPTPTQGAIVDGDSETVWMEPARTSAIGPVIGGFPTADPSADANTLLVLPLNASGTDPALTGLTSTTNVTVSYCPRSAYLGDGA